MHVQLEGFIISTEKNQLEEDLLGNAFSAVTYILSHLFISITLWY